MIRTISSDRRFVGPHGGLIGLRFYKSQNGGDDPRRKTPQNYEMLMESSYTSQDHYTHIPSGSSGWVTSDAFVGSPHFSSLDSSIENEQLVKLLKRGRGSGFYPSLFLAEAQESVNMIGSTARNLAAAYSAARRGNLTTAWRHLTTSAPFPRDSVRRFADNFSSGWLSWIYGWKPLVSDIAQAANYIVTKQNPSPVIYQYRATARKPGYGLNALGVQTPGKVESRFQWILFVSQQNFSTPAPNPLWDMGAVAWEVTPFSFVADWFYPIGSYLEARSLAESCNAQLVKTVTDFCSLGSASGPLYRFNDGPNGSFKKIRMVRSVAPVSSFIRLPSLNDGLTGSVTRMLSSLALLHTVTKHR